MRSPELLVTCGLEPLKREHGAPEREALGRLLTPRHYPNLDETAGAGMPWAADNDCFGGLDVARFSSMLEALGQAGAYGLGSCRFVSVPDVLRCAACRQTVDGYGGGPACSCGASPRLVYGDALLTARRFEEWAPALERRGLPVALVLQDGLETVLGWLSRSWHRLDAVFVGGSDAFKEGAVAAEVVRQARRDGKWAHWGRVNTRRRFDYARRIGCDSFDGTKWARWRHEYLETGLAWCEEPARLELEGFEVSA